MGNSKNAEKMKIILGDISPKLKDEGFRKRGNTYNRTVEPGVIHVVNFQMGRYELNFQKTPYSFNMYGKFTINLGIYISEVKQILSPWMKDTGFISESSCEIRCRIGELTESKNDIWWNLNYDTNELSKDVQKHVEIFALPYFKKSKSRDLIIDRLRNEEKLQAGRGKLALGVMLYFRGEYSEAEQIIKEEYQNSLGKPYCGFIEDVAISLNIDL